MDTLKFAKPYYLSSFNGWLERYISSNGCRNALIEMESKAVLLKMQRALFTLCCQVDNPLPRLTKLLTELYNKENLQFDTSANVSPNKSITSGATSTDASDVSLNPSGIVGVGTGRFKCKNVFEIIRNGI